MATDKKTQAFALPVLRTLYENGRLDLRPDYQRGPVWTRSQRQLLMDSLMRGFDVPKLYFRKVERNGTSYEVVDGQQRILAIMGFYDGSFSLLNDADPVKEEEVKGKKFAELGVDGLFALQTAQLDVVILTDYSDDQIRDMFARLQNGTPLNAAEKRHAWTFAMVEVVKELAKHPAFEKICDFSDTRYAYEDMAAKLVHELLAGRIADIRESSLRTTYKDNPNIKLSDPEPQLARRVLDFLAAALAPKTVRLKRNALISLGIIVADLLEQYSLSRYVTEFGDWYEDFELARMNNNSLEEDDENRNQQLTEFTDAARNDNLPAMTFRDKVLRESLFASLIDLEPKDPTRDFSPEQRLFVFLRDGKKCQACGVDLTLEQCHIDHIKPHSAGGRTAVTNARATCGPCNQKKGSAYRA